MPVSKEKIIMSTIFFWIVCAFLFVWYLRYLERATLFAPSKEVTATPADIGLSFEDVFVPVKNGQKIHGWFIQSTGQETLLYFHGNAGNISDRLDKLAIFHQLGLNVLIIDYRGYGKSEGHPTENGIYEDALVSFDYLMTRIDVDQKKIIAYGASLGGAVAVELALHRPVAGLIVDSTFTSAQAMARRIYPFIPSFLVNIRLDSINKISQIKVPKLIIHSSDDTMIPFEMGRTLFDAASEPKLFLETKGNHNGNHLEDTKNYSSGIAAFLQQLKGLNVY
jgi:fermentation-respiration switch protein FrsA (DUF1100 family)